MTSMIELRERFVQHPLMPSAVVEQQNRWRARWGMQEKTPEPGENWRYRIEVAGEGANDPRRRLRFGLLNGRHGAKYFLTGSKGAGKSTTAYALWDDPEIVERYTLLGFTIHDYLNLVDTDASQVIAVMIAHLVELLRDANEDAKLGDIEARETYRELEKVLKGLLPAARLEQVNVNVFGLFVASFKESAPARAKFREFVDGRVDEVMKLFDELNGLLEAHTGKQTLFVVDDLDKVQSDEVRRKMFQIQLPMLLRPRCAALYSYPIEVDLDPQFESLKRGQANRYVLANVKLAVAPEGPMLAEGCALMREFVVQRLDTAALDELIELTPEQWNRVLFYSAGNFRELSRILCHAFEIAAMDARTSADLRCFELALERVRQDYNPFVQQFRGFLTQVRDNRSSAAAPEELKPELLSKLLAAFAVVEYPNEPGWLGLNPAVADLLEGRPSKL
jgi:hypothetical protein